ncbi:MAG: FG-GAP repeat domain-containing protein [Myxococcales bacterium]|nr:VCBS repeat-containing protein [Myxococcales bacterium]
MTALSLATATAARAETVTANLSFTNAAGTPTPIANATVEIWRFAPRGWFGIWSWGADFTAFTDSSGHLSVSMPFVASGVIYGLRVYATNPAAVVYTQDLYTIPFYRQPGLPGPEVLRTVKSPADVLDFSFNFADAWATNHFNAADAVLKGFNYASARRDPRESDTIAQLAVLMNSLAINLPGNTFYDPVSHALRLSSGFAMDDPTILHEYGHYLEERISSFYGIASNHDGCTATVGAVHVESAGFAWMEGFASYFSAAVALASPPGAITSTGFSGTIPPSTLNFPSCPGTSLPGSSIEDFVGGALFRLIESPSRCTTGVPNDVLVSQIFDRELDIGWTNPTLQQFVDAWIARGLDLPPLLATFGAATGGLVLPAPTVHYGASRAAKMAVFRPGAPAVWWVLGGQAGTTTAFGQTGDVPVPADYDGDGVTDLAFYRPSDGTWSVVLSATGFIQTVQWGMPGDIPLPADYDGDRQADLAVYRPSTGTLIVRTMGCGTKRETFLGYGTPFVGDFDGNGIADPGVYENSTGNFRMTLDSDPGWVFIDRVTPYTLAGYKTPKFIPLPRDYDGDGFTDLAVFEPATATWYYRPSSSWQIMTAKFGAAGDKPVPADYDGDGKADLAVWTESTGTWNVLQSSTGTPKSQQWGAPGDVPVPSR